MVLHIKMNSRWIKVKCEKWKYNIEKQLYVHMKGNCLLNIIAIKSIEKN